MTSGASRLTLQHLLDREEIKDVLYRYATGVDTCDWKLFRSVFVDEIKLDFSALHGATPAQTMTADAWVTFCRSVTPGFDATQHMLSNFQFELEENIAVVRAYLRAVHCLANESGENTNTLVGYYRHRLARTPNGWKICECKLTPTWTSGHPRLFEMAAERVASGNAQRT